MRILQVTKFAGHVGGVESHVSLLTSELEKLGHEVDSFTYDDLPADRKHFSLSPSNLRERRAVAGPVLWSQAALAGLDAVVTGFRPDVIHFHSIYHQLSPSVLAAARRRRIPAVMTLHDYKLIAP